MREGKGLGISLEEHEHFVGEGAGGGCRGQVDRKDLVGRALREGVGPRESKMGRTSLR